MKRIIASLGAVAMVAAAVVPASAFGGWHWGGGTDTLNNYANITTSMTLNSNSGANQQKNLGGALSGYHSWGGSTVTQSNVGTTGAAQAGGFVENQANNNTGCNCFDDVNNAAYVMTGMTVNANTGNNTQMNLGGTFGKGTVGQGNMLGTGGALSEGHVFTVVNSNYEMVIE